MSDHGRFIWYELMAPDMGQAKSFYGDVLGWTANPMPNPGGGPPYTIFQTGGDGVAGGMPLGDMAAQGVPPNWTGYVAVDDCDAAAEKVKSLGGAVRQPPMDIPGVGRFAIIADPGGAVIAIMKPAPPQGGTPPERPVRGAPGHAGWRELMAGDLDKAWPFYAALFGWKKDQAHDMGPMGVYQLFANQDGVVGGMMTKPAQMPMAAWAYYFEVPDINAAAGKVKASGGQVLNGPMEVPDGSWVVQAQDPGGAHVSFVTTHA